MNDTWVPVIAILIMFGGPIAWAITNRVLTFLERSQMIQRGMTPPPDARTMRRMARNRWYAPGPVPGPPPQMDPSFMAQEDFCVPSGSPDRMLRKGIVLAFIGLALTIGLSFIGYHDGGGPLGAPSVTPGPWLLGGLIPMFIGVAQVLLAVMSGANFGTGPRMGGYTQAPPPQSGAYQGKPIDDPIAPPPWAHRPSYEELQRPVPPPEKR